MVFGRLLDWAIDTYIGSRIGNEVKSPKTCLYYQLQYEEDPQGRITRRSTYENHPYIAEKSYQSKSASYFTYQPQIVANESVPLCVKPPSNLSIKPTSPSSLRILVISDTHDRHHLLEDLPECDILIHSGDILMTSRVFTKEYSMQKYKSFVKWLKSQKATYKIVIGGNHDNCLEQLSQKELQSLFPANEGIYYLCNESINFQGLSIFATPYSSGASPNKAFQSDSFKEETKNKLKSLLNPVDILITHGECSDFRELLPQFSPTVMHISGHCHVYHGVHEIMHHSSSGSVSVLSVAAPIMNGRFNPFHLPIVVDCVIEKASP
jgi:predicted phosphodiesterase